VSALPSDFGPTKLLAFSTSMCKTSFDRLHLSGLDLPKKWKHCVCTSWN
jgi:hypothetical protein